MNQSDREIDTLVSDALHAESETADLEASDELLERISGRAAAPGVVHGPHRRFRWAAAALVLLMCGVGAAALFGRSDDAVVTAGHGSDRSTVFPAPAPGDAVAEMLADGTPVWVVRHKDGEVTVLDASSTHRPFGARSLVGWCEASRGFEEGQNGSNFDERGRKRAGPAPRDLDTYAVTLTDGGGAVEVGELAAGAQRGDASEGAPPVAPADGPTCASGGSGGEDHVNGYNPGSSMLHQFDAAEAIPVSDAPESSDHLVLYRSTTMLLRVGSPTIVCFEPLDEPPFACDGPVAPQLQLTNDVATATLTGSFLARGGSTRLFDITFVDGSVYDPSPEVADAGLEDDFAVGANTIPPPSNADLIEGTIDTGETWRLSLDGSNGEGLCLHVDVDVERAVTALACVPDEPVADPNRAGLLDDDRVPRFVFGAAPVGTTRVVVNLINGVEVSADITGRTVASFPGGATFYAVELPGVADGAVVEFFASDGSSRGGRPVSAAEDAPFTLLVTNQSFDDPDITVTVRVDDEEVLSQVVAVGNQHELVRLPLDLDPGEHTMVIDVDDRITTIDTFVIPANDPYFGLVMYQPGEDSPRLDVTFSDQPMGLG